MNIQDFSCGDRMRARHTGKLGVIREIRYNTQEVVIDTGSEQVIKHFNDLIPESIGSNDTLRELIGSSFIYKEIVIKESSGIENTYFILSDSCRFDDCLFIPKYDGYSYPSLTLYKGVVYVDIIRSSTKLEDILYIQQENVDIDRIMSISFEYQLNRLLTLLYSEYR